MDDRLFAHREWVLSNPLVKSTPLTVMNQLERIMTNGMRKLTHQINDSSDDALMDKDATCFGCFRVTYSN